MSTKTDIFISTNDVSSLVSLFSIASGYDIEANLKFEREGFGLSFSTSDNLAMIDFYSSEDKLLGYYYEDLNPIKYIGVSLKKCYAMLRGIPAKSVGQIYKTNDDEDLYVNPEGSSTSEGANKIPTINLPISTIDPPTISPEEKYIKVNTLDFASMCNSISKADCKTIRFSIVGKFLHVKGFDDKNECMSAKSFSNAGPNDSYENEVVNCDNQSLKVKKGKFNIIIHKKPFTEQFFVETTIDKLKPLSKINNQCKNGIIYVYVCKETIEPKQDKFIALKVNTGQIGVIYIYLRDSSSYNKQVYPKNVRNHSFYN